MKKEQRAIRDAEIIRLKNLNYSSREIAKKLHCGKSTVNRLCNIGEPCQMHSDKQAAHIVEARNPEFEYVGNYTGSNGTADIRCRTCGEVTTRSWTAIKRSAIRCNNCWQAEIEKNRELKYKRIEAERLQAEAERIEQKKLNIKGVQMELKVCPVCRSIFIASGNKKYCSDKCQHQNRWHMKDAYRYLFPLEEVYERDNGICYICGERCDWSDHEEVDGVIIYGNRYPSRDHVIPKSKGGLNTWENIRLAHRGCNSRKRDAVDIPLV